LWLREFLWDLYPDCNELIYDNYNALAIGFAPSDKAEEAFCSLAFTANMSTLNLIAVQKLEIPVKF